jgi:hypothetical protein
MKIFLITLIVFSIVLWVWLLAEIIKFNQEYKKHSVEFDQCEELESTDYWMTAENVSKVFWPGYFKRHLLRTINYYILPVLYVMSIVSICHNDSIDPDFLIAPIWNFLITLINVDLTCTIVFPIHSDLRKMYQARCAVSRRILHK